MRTATNAAMPSQNSLRRKFHSQRNSPNSTILNAANTTRPPRAGFGKSASSGPANSRTHTTASTVTRP